MNKITILAKIAELFHLNQFVQYIKVETNKNKVKALTNKLIKSYPDVDQNWIKHISSSALNNSMTVERLDYDNVEMICRINCEVLLGLRSTNGLLPFLDIGTATAPVGSVFPMVYKEMEPDDNDTPSTLPMSGFHGVENIQTKRFSMEVVSKTYECRTRQLRTFFPIELAQDLSGSHNVDGNKEVMEILVQEIKDELIADIINLISYDNPVTELDFELNGAGSLLSQATLYMQKTRMHIKPEYIVLNNTNNSIKDVNVTQTELSSPISPLKDLIIIGNEENSHIKSMYHYMLHSITCAKAVDPHTFSPMIRFMVRYGIVENNKAPLIRIKQKPELLQE